MSSQYATELRQGQGNIGISLTLKNGKTLYGQWSIAGMLWRPSVMQNLIYNDQAYRFLQTVWSTPVYWEKMFFEALTMLKAFGTYFITFSAADNHWPEIKWAIGLEKDRHFTDGDVLCMTWEEKSQWSCSNPVMAVRQFQYHFNPLPPFV